MPWMMIALFSIMGTAEQATISESLEEAICAMRPPLASGVCRLTEIIAADDFGHMIDAAPSVRSSATANHSACSNSSSITADAPSALRTLKLLGAPRGDQPCGLRKRKATEAEQGDAAGALHQNGFAGFQMARLNQSGTKPSAPQPARWMLPRPSVMRVLLTAISFVK